MIQSINGPTGELDREALFRRTMTGAADRVWELGVDEEALAALYDVIECGALRREASADGPVVPSES
jgi:hypothetical protein